MAVVHRSQTVVLHEAVLMMFCNNTIPVCNPWPVLKAHYCTLPKQCMDLRKGKSPMRTLVCCLLDTPNPPIHPSAAQSALMSSSCIRSSQKLIHCDQQESTHKVHRIHNRQPCGQQYTPMTAVADCHCMLGQVNVVACNDKRPNQACSRTTAAGLDCRCHGRCNDRAKVKAAT